MKTLTPYIGVLLLTIGCLSTGFGQSRFSLSVNVAPVYSHVDYKAISPIADPITQSPTTEIVNRSHSLGYSFGLIGHYAFSSKWSASAGIWASQYVSAKGNFAINGIHTPINQTNNHPFNYSYKAPLMLNYQSSTNRLSPYFSAGATLDFRGTSYVDLGNGEEVPVKFGKAIVITPLLGIGAIYRLNDHLSLLAQPMIQYNIQSHSTYTYYHSYQLSLQAQLRYHF